MMGDHEDSPFTAQPFYSVHKLLFLLFIQAGGDFIQNDNLGMTEKKTDDAYKLGLTGRYTAFCRRKRGIQAPFKAFQPVIKPQGAYGFINILIPDIRIE